MAVNHCFMALPSVKKEQLKRVLSHPQALAQCEIALSKLGVIQENVDDTALASQLVASNSPRDAGAIASAQAAEIYGLKIVQVTIQDSSDNITCFLILAREPIIPKTDRPFKIESRPQRKRPLKVVDYSNHGTAKYFDYLFYIDIEASMAEPYAQHALAHLQEFVTFLRVLGSYPMDTSM